MLLLIVLFFFNATATTEIYTFPYTTLFRSVDKAEVDNLMIIVQVRMDNGKPVIRVADQDVDPEDRKSTRLNSSHTVISYAVFCLKKKKRLIIMKDITR